jgi:hypothetical protein
MNTELSKLNELLLKVHDFTQHIPVIMDLITKLDVGQASLMARMDSVLNGGSVTGASVGNGEIKPAKKSTNVRVFFNNKCKEATPLPTKEGLISLHNSFVKKIITEEELLELEEKNKDDLKKLSGDKLQKQKINILYSSLDQEKKDAVRTLQRSVDDDQKSEADEQKAPVPEQKPAEEEKKTSKKAPVVEEKELKLEPKPAKKPRKPRAKLIDMPEVKEEELIPTELDSKPKVPLRKKQIEPDEEEDIIDTDAADEDGVEVDAEPDE